MGAQKTPIQKSYEINIGQDSKTLTFWMQVDNLTGQECPQFLIKATNTQQFTTAITSKWLQNI